MPLFRRRSEKTLPKTSSLSVYGQGRTSTPPCTSRSDKSDSSSVSSLNVDDKQQAFLAFAEATFDPSLPLRDKSRLSKTLEEVLHDNAALAYFIQFMEAKSAKHLIKFWLEAESFNLSVSTRLSGQTPKTTPDEETLLPGPLLSSDSSGCISDKSDEVFQPSSHTNSCDSASTENNSCTDRHKNVCTVSAASTVDPCERISNQGKHHTRLRSNNENVSLSSTEMPPRCLTDQELNEHDVNNILRVTESKYIVNKGSKENSVHSCESVSSDLPPAEEEWVEDAEKYFSEKPPQSKDSISRLQTSIEQDANSIYTKYIAQDAQFPVGVSDELRKEIIDRICKPDGSVDPQCFVPAQEFVVRRMDKEFFPAFLRSSFHCKHQIDVLTSGNVYLADVLYNESALFYFMEFMEQEGVRHLVDFLLIADNFRKHLLSLQVPYNGIEAQNDAMVLYDKYFSLQATSPLGFSDTIRYEVEQNICREEGPLPDCFRKPVMILMQYLEKTYLLQFFNSQLYFKYISECIITIQSGGTDFDSQPKYSGSDSGSEHSLPISSVNTLLAMDGKQPGAPSRILKNIHEQDMRIDTGQFKPDSLWRRHLAGKLQMAYVDKLGKVVTEFEPEPDRRRESRISKAVKKLVNWEEDKSQEDMAWKVAEMIVKDVCTLTMSDISENPKDKVPGVT